MSTAVQTDINNHAKFDKNLKCKVGENDLIAYEAHYQSSCKFKVGQSAPHISSTNNDTKANAALEPHFEKLIDILNSGCK